MLLGIDGKNRGKKMSVRQWRFEVTLKIART